MSSDEDPQRDIVAELSAFLREAGIVPTFDPHASIAKPCEICGTTAMPRELIVIGTHTRPMGCNLNPGTPIRRPMCAPCIARTEQR